MLEGITPASGPSEWLEKVKAGYGKWFSHAFSSVGFQDVEDLKAGVGVKTLNTVARICSRTLLGCFVPFRMGTGQPLP